MRTIAMLMLIIFLAPAFADELSDVQQDIAQLYLNDIVIAKSQHKVFQVLKEGNQIPEIIYPVKAWAKIIIILVLVVGVVISWYLGLLSKLIKAPILAQIGVCLLTLCLLIGLYNVLGFMY